MKSPKPAKFTVANAEVDAARARISKRLTTLFIPMSKISDRLPKPATRCPGCGYMVHDTCDVCKPSKEEA